MDGMAGQRSALNWVVHLSVLLLVLIWLFPTMGLFVSSFRTGDQITASGWWSSVTQQEQQMPAIRISGDEVQDGDLWVIEGFLVENADGAASLSAWGTSSREPTAYGAGDTAELSDGRTLTVEADASFRFTAPESQAGGRLPRVFPTISAPPDFSWTNYDNILGRSASPAAVQETLTSDNPQPVGRSVALLVLGISLVAAVGFMGGKRVFAGLDDGARAVTAAILAGFAATILALWFLPASLGGSIRILVATLIGIAIAGACFYLAARGKWAEGVAAGLFAFVIFLAGLYWTFNINIIVGGGSEGMAAAFLNTITVAIPATIIPILIAAFAAYALAWMEFPGRAILIAAVVALLVVPLQLALIPLLSLHGGAMAWLVDLLGTGTIVENGRDDLQRFSEVNWLGRAFGYEVGDRLNSKGYLGVWLAHTGFGMPLAIYLLRNYMVGLPRDIIENAKVDGATDFQIFVKIILPLSFPALAAFAIFQFLWTWNDLLVALVFLIDSSGETTVMTHQVTQLLGTRGGDWEILATAAFISIAVPLGVFFLMQRYLVRGLLAGSVK